MTQVLFADYMGVSKKTVEAGKKATIIRQERLAV